MKLSSFFAFLACICCQFSFAQAKPLTVQGVAPNLYLSHTVAAKENYYSIGRMYNISPKDQIAPFNNLQMEKGLNPGQLLKIPLVATNFVQDGTAPEATEVLIPVYHTVAQKEGLYRVSVNYNKVPLETLKQWNNLKSEAVGNGTKLIIGYLKVSKDQSPLANMGVAVKPVIETPKVDTKVPPVTKVEKPVVKTEKPVALEPKKDPQPVNNNPVITEKPDAGKFKGGAFKTVYSEQAGVDMQTEAGTGSVFKSTSGWTDGKYYCLHNTAQPGTIIKVTSNVTGKSIYAKVLDAMPDIKQNTGIIIRISNAAADDLGVGENKFDCSLSYSK